MNRRHLLRYRDVAEALAISESQVRKYVRAGYLTEVYLPDVRAVRFAANEVQAFAQRILAVGRRPHSTTADAEGRPSRPVAAP